MTGPHVSPPSGAAGDVDAAAGDGARDGAATGLTPPRGTSTTSALHVVVAAGADALPDRGAALEVLDHALETWGATGELVQAGSDDELRDTVAQVVAAGHEPVVVPGSGSDLRLLPDDAPTGATVVRLDLDDRRADRSPGVRRHARGRGLDGLRHAVDTWVIGRTHPPTLVHRYGDDPDQHADLRLPPSASAPSSPACEASGASGQRTIPVAVLVHGGYWRSRWESDLMEPLAAQLGDRGWATWNVEYRRPDDHDWDATTVDVAAAVDALADLADVAAPKDTPDPDDPGAQIGRTGATLDLSRVVLIGHSAGGQLVTRLAADLARDRDARVRPALTVALAGVLDLADADRRGLGNDAVADALGGLVEERPDRLHASSPVERVPVGSPLAVVCGDDDELLSQSHAFARAARAAGDDVVEVTAPGDHFALIDPRSAIWTEVLRVIERHRPT